MEWPRPGIRLGRPLRPLTGSEGTLFDPVPVPPGVRAVPTFGVTVGDDGQATPIVYVAVHCSGAEL